jgi:hypothetical protein
MALNDAEQKAADKAQHANAKRLSEASDLLPDVAEKRYAGPDALGQAMLRGGVFATLGWFGGRMLGDVGAKPKLLPNGEPHPNYRSFKSRNFGVSAAFVGGVMGAYGGMKYARLHRKQVTDLQDALVNEHAKCDELRQELKLQLNGQGRLAHYNPDWEKEDKPPVAPEEKEGETHEPSSQVSARETQLVAEKKAPQKDVSAAL